MKALFILLFLIGSVSAFSKELSHNMTGGEICNSDLPNDIVTEILSDGVAANGAVKN